MLPCLPRGWGCGLTRLGSPSRDRGPTRAWGKELLFGGLGVLTTWRTVLSLARVCPHCLPWLLDLERDGHPCCIPAVEAWAGVEGLGAS
jgi:hypothetical protein